MRSVDSRFIISQASNQVTARRILDVPRRGTGGALRAGEPPSTHLRDGTTCGLGFSSRTATQGSFIDAAVCSDSRG